MTGIRRLISFLAYMAAISVVEWLTSPDAVGMSMFYQVAAVAGITVHLTGVAVDKFKNGGDPK
jgi:hypothetical protein